MPERCPACLAGHFKPARAVFIRIYEGTLIHMPRVPAWKCDLCGLVYFDSTIISHIEVLIGEAGPPPNHYTPPPPLPAGDDGSADEAQIRAKTD
jgi:YgiT-type zinc finger domain-containing protein